MENILKDFDIEKVKRKNKLDKILTVRITRKNFEWIKEHRISATRFFNYCLHNIMKLVKEE